MKRTALALALATAFAAAALAQTYNLKAPIAKAPAFLTSSGQSADVEMVKVLLSRSKLEFTMDAAATAKALSASGAKTLVVAIGGSSKGLGAAGISPEAELERTKSLLAEARKLGMKVIGVHVGGEARRGELSDRFIAAVVPACDYVVIVAEGDADGLFKKLCGAKIPLDAVEKISQAGAPLAAAFQK